MMKIDLKKIDRKDIEQLLLDKEMNIAAAQGLFDFCFYSADHSADETNYTKTIAEYLELNLNNQEDKHFYESRIVPSIKKINVKDYEDNYYRESIKPDSVKENGYELTYLKIKPMQSLPYDDILVDENFVEVSQIGYFTENFEYLAVIKDDVVWMSTDPNEINTMRPSINKALGNVLAFGLGLGYFPLMCAAKEEVKSVTIVEKDPEIIKIFKKHILPLSIYKDKIRIIEGDAFNFAHSDLTSYDFLFIDIWHNPEDGLPLYLKFRKILKNKNLETDYWLEKSILAMYRRCLLTIIEENLLGYKDKDYLKAKTEYDQIINNLYFKTKNLSLNSFKDVKQLLQDNSLKNLI